MKSPKLDRWECDSCHTGGFVVQTPERTLSMEYCPTCGKHRKDPDGPKVVQ